MDLRAILLLVLLSIVLAVGGHFLLVKADASLFDFLRILMFQSVEHQTKCFFVALGAIVAAVLALLSCVAVFSEDEDLDEYQHEEFPFGAIPFFALISLGLFWLSLGCVVKASAQNVVPAEPIELPIVETMPEPVVSATPAPSLNKETPVAVAIPLEDDVQAKEPLPIASPPSPRLYNYGEPAVWPYKLPLVKNDQAVVTLRVTAFLEETAFPLDDRSGEVRALLCDNAWVAIVGSASEEGPLERNQRRSRLRISLAADRAEIWLAHHSANCEKPIILGVDRGQHQLTAAGQSGGPAATAKQRALSFIVRGRVPGEVDLTKEDVRSELADYLAAQWDNPDNLVDRGYLRRPQIVTP